MKPSHLLSTLGAAHLGLALALPTSPDVAALSTRDIKPPMDSTPFASPNNPDKRSLLTRGVDDVDDDTLVDGDDNDRPAPNVGETREPNLGDREEDEFQESDPPEGDQEEQEEQEEGGDDELVELDGLANAKDNEQGDVNALADDELSGDQDVESFDGTQDDQQDELEGALGDLPEDSVVPQDDEQDSLIKDDDYEQDPLDGPREDQQDDDTELTGEPDDFDGPRRGDDTDPDELDDPYPARPRGNLLRRSLTRSSSDPGPGTSWQRGPERSGPSDHAGPQPQGVHNEDRGFRAAKERLRAFLNTPTGKAIEKTVFDEKVSGKESFKVIGSAFVQEYGEKMAKKMARKIARKMANDVAFGRTGRPGFTEKVRTYWQKRHGKDADGPDAASRPAGQRRSTRE